MEPTDFPWQQTETASTIAIKERLITLYQRTNRIHSEEYQQLVKYLTLFGRLGMKQVFGGGTTLLDHQKVKLELDFNGYQYPTCQEDIDKIKDRLHEINALEKRRRGRIKATQANYGISGISTQKVTFKDFTFYYPYHDTEGWLELIPSDFKIIKRYLKAFVVIRYLALEAAHSMNMYCYCRSAGAWSDDRDCWIPVTGSEVLEMEKRSLWGYVWTGFEKDIFFLTMGQTTELHTADSEKYWLALVPEGKTNRDIMM